jgi:NhaP-type Na+/H+ and K+/H+ antiporter
LFFKLIILALSLIFFIRPLMLFSHQISYKIRRKFEK